MRCALCHDDRDHPAHACGACGTWTHPDCLADAARCPTLGCLGVWTRPPEAPNNAASVLLGLVFLVLFAACGLILRAGMRTAHTLLPRPPALVGEDGAPTRHQTLARRPGGQ